jgi:hypothetical protein
MRNEERPAMGETECICDGLDGHLIWCPEANVDEFDEDPTAGFVYCIEKGTGWQ